MITLLVIGLSLGAVYALVAIGFTLIYETTGVVNFAQGSFVMVAAMVAVWALEALSAPFVLALALGVLAATLWGVVLAIAVIIPLWRRRASEFIIILATLMFLLLSENLVLNFIGSQPRSLPSIIGVRINLLGRGVSGQTFVIVGVSLLLAAGLTVFLARNRLGMAMRACSIDQSSSRLLGISPYKIAVISFALSAFIGGIGGVLIAPIQFTAFNVAATYSVKGFLAAIVGGLGNIKGAVIGGLIVGVFEAIIGIYVSSYYLNVFVMTALVLVLLIRPRGIFGEPSLA